MRQKRKKRFLIRLKILGVYFSISNLRLQYLNRRRNYGLNSKQRRNLRQLALDAHGGVCQVCGKHLTVDNVDIHHIIPLSMNGRRSDPKNIMAVCRDCHCKIHMNPLMYAEEVRKHIEAYPELLGENGTIEEMAKRTNPRQNFKLDKNWAFGPLTIQIGQ